MISPCDTGSPRTAIIATAIHRGILILMPVRRSEGKGKNLSSTALQLNVSSRRDYYFQRRVMRRLEREGYYVVRLTGLRRPFDLVAVRRDGTLAVRCRTNGYLSVEEASRLSELALRYGMRAALAYPSGGPDSISFRSL